MAGHSVRIGDEVPTVNPSGAPGGDFQRIDAGADSFGGSVARATSQFGQGLEKAGSALFDVAELQAKMDSQTHAAEVHSWQSDQVTDAQEKFLQLRGKAAEMELPNFKKTIDDIGKQAREQAGTPFAASLIDTQGRRLTDNAYSGASRHAASQKSTWYSETARSNAESSGNQAVLRAVTSPEPSIAADPNVQSALFASDQEVRNYYSLHGYDGEALDAQVAQNRGKNVKEIVNQLTADGSKTGLQKAIKFFHNQTEKIDPGSRYNINNALKAKAAVYDGQRAASNVLGKPEDAPPLAPVAQVPAVFVGAVQRSEGFAPRAKWDYKQYTNGFGTKAESPDEVIDLATATKRFNVAMENAAKFVDSVNPDLDPGTRAALTSLTFNAGTAWGASGLGQKVRAGDLLGARELFLQYNKAGGAVNEGLSMRRQREAQWFGQAELTPYEATRPMRARSEVLVDLQNDPYLQDHPQAMAAAIANVDRVYQIDTAAQVDHNRAKLLQDHARKEASDEEELRVFSNIHSAKPTITAQEIILNPRMTKEAKERMVAQLEKASGDRDEHTYGPGFYAAYQAIHQPPGTEGRITDANQIYSRVGRGGDLTVKGADKLIQEIQGRKTPEGAAESEMRKQFLANAKAQISGSSEGLGLKDPKGEELYLKFMAQALPAYDAGRAAGKTPAQLLNPESPDYIGKGIAGFRRPMAEWVSDMTRDNGPGTPGAAAAKPVKNFDIGSIKTLNDALVAYRNGNITKAQADQMAIERGWGVKRPQVPVQ